MLLSKNAQNCYFAQQMWHKTHFPASSIIDSTVATARNGQHLSQISSMTLSLAYVTFSTLEKRYPRVQEQALERSAWKIDDLPLPLRAALHSTWIFLRVAAALTSIRNDHLEPWLSWENRPEEKRPRKLFAAPAREFITLVSRRWSSVRILHCEKRDGRWVFGHRECTSGDVSSAAVSPARESRENEVRCCVTGCERS